MIERIGDSMELLKATFDLPDLPVMRHSNAKKHPKPTAWSVERLKVLIPMDVYVYDNAVRLFDQRLLDVIPDRFTPFSSVPTVDFLQENEK